MFVSCIVYFHPIVIAILSRSLCHLKTLILYSYNVHVDTFTNDCTPIARHNTAKVYYVLLEDAKYTWIRWETHRGFLKYLKKQQHLQYSFFATKSSGNYTYNFNLIHYLVSTLYLIGYFYKHPKKPNPPNFLSLQNSIIKQIMHIS